MAVCNHTSICHEWFPLRMQNNHMVNIIQFKYWTVTSNTLIILVNGFHCRAYLAFFSTSSWTSSTEGKMHHTRGRLVWSKSGWEWNQQPSGCQTLTPPPLLLPGGMSWASWQYFLGTFAFQVGSYLFQGFFLSVEPSVAFNTSRRASPQQFNREPSFTDPNQ